MARETGEMRTIRHTLKPPTPARSRLACGPGKPCPGYPLHSVAPGTPSIALARQGHFCISNPSPQTSTGKCRDLGQRSFRPASAPSPASRPSPWRIASSRRQMYRAFRTQCPKGPSQLPCRFPRVTPSAPSITSHRAALQCRCGMPPGSAYCCFHLPMLLLAQNYALKTNLAALRTAFEDPKAGGCPACSQNLVNFWCVWRASVPSAPDAADPLPFALQVRLHMRAGPGPLHHVPRDEQRVEPRADGRELGRDLRRRLGEHLHSHQPPHAHEPELQARGGVTEEALLCPAPFHSSPAPPPLLLVFLQLRGLRLVLLHREGEGRRRGRHCCAPPQRR